MKNKWIFIGIGALFIIVVGIIIFIHFTAPEILTKTPLELITGRVIQNGEKDVIFTPTKPVGVTDNFILSIEHWQNTFRVNFPEGSPYRGGIGFASVPIGTRLYSPIDGYISIIEFVGEGGTLTGIVLSTSPDWKMSEDTSQKKYLTFFLRKATLLTLEPKRGEAFAVIEDASPFQGSLGEEISLLITTSTALGESSDQSISDMRTYLKNTIEKIN